MLKKFEPFTGFRWWGAIESETQVRVLSPTLSGLGSGNVTPS